MKDIRITVTDGSEVIGKFTIKPEIAKAMRDGHFVTIRIGRLDKAAKGFHHFEVRRK